MNTRAVGLAALAASGALALSYVARAPRRSADAQAQLDRAVAAVDRELAANLELTTMFDQTRQAIVLENGQFAAHQAILAREVPGAHARAADLYRRIPDTESAMERRGPANSLRDADRLIVEGWEGDARDLQHALRRAAASAGPSALGALAARLRRRVASAVATPRGTVEA